MRALANAKKRHIEKFMCADCHEEHTVNHDGASGYAEVGRRGVVPIRICYECCAKRDQQMMKKTGRMVLYVDIDKLEVTNWPGTLRFKIDRRRTSPLRSRRGGMRRDVWFFDKEGWQWHGVQHNTDTSQVAHCKRTKTQRVRFTLERLADLERYKLLETP